MSSAICRELIDVFSLTPIGPNNETMVDLLERDIADPQPEPDPYLALAAAARGDKAAQTWLADTAMFRVLSGKEADPLATLNEGLMFARMAAVQGDSQDKMRAACLLSIGAELAEGLTHAQYAAETIAWMEIVADAGGQYGAGISTALTRFADREQPETLTMAKEFYARIRAALEVE